MQSVRVSREFGFEAAHWLPHVSDNHKCKRLHGHHYRVRLTVEGPIDERLGWVIDYADIKRAFDDWYAVLDHHCLNDITELSNSTAENLAVFLFERMKVRLPGLCSVAIKETPDTEVV